ncbi:MAG: glycosyltransferase [Chloroflexi bacterium]|nr:glycosyltransferase [Chloroflexota bacterium]MBU1661300.1 glycosyltransferase [Chloroflexota bacterium]
MNKRVDWLVTELNTIGGTETFVYQTVPRLRHLGWDVRVITLMSGGKLIDELRQENVPVIELGLKNKMDLDVVWRLRKIWQENPPALLHTHLYHAGILGRLVARWVQISPVIVHQHGPEHNRSGFRTWLDRQFSHWVTRYVTTCEAVSHILETREGISDQQIETISNGILEPERRIPPTRPKDWLAPEGYVSVVCVGRLSPEKGQDLLLQALAKLKKQNMQVYTVFIGDGPQRDQLSTDVVRLDLQNRVSFLGIRSDVYDWLFNADIFVLPSDWEGVSLAILEAMAASLPVVATAVGGTPEVVLDGVTGLLVPPRDPDALAKAILRLLGDPGLRLRMGQAGRERVEKHFAISETVRKTEALYQKLLAEKGIVL